MDIHSRALAAFFGATLLLQVEGFASNREGSPFAFTQTAWWVSNTTAVLNGMVTPNCFTPAAWFEWGVDESYGQATDISFVDPGTSVVAIRRPICELSREVMYHCRLVASNQSGTVFGADRR